MLGSGPAQQAASHLEIRLAEELTYVRQQSLPHEGVQHRSRCFVRNALAIAVVKHLELEGRLVMLGLVPLHEPPGVALEHAPQRTGRIGLQELCTEPSSPPSARAARLRRQDLALAVLRSDFPPCQRGRGSGTGVVPLRRRSSVRSQCRRGPTDLQPKLPKLVLLLVGQLVSHLLQKLHLPLLSRGPPPAHSSGSASGASGSRDASGGRRKGRSGRLSPLPHGDWRHSEDGATNSRQFRLAAPARAAGNTRA
mmetsp:Transcript_299/g.1260  ORF Transcript_299/g.1260 Transcript_299/m.1260 type:complete len:252 (+) Transcript_299:2565-3320(+)